MGGGVIKFQYAQYTHIQLSRIMDKLPTCMGGGINIHYTIKERSPKNVCICDQGTAYMITMYTITNNGHCNNALLFTNTFSGNAVF